MTGDVNGDGRGIIPRAFHDIMTQSQAMQGSGWTISLGVSIVELYNEDLRDLLADGKYSTDHLDHNTKNKYKITKVNNKVVVQGLTSIPIDVTDYATGMLQFEKVITDAATVRSTASTSMNSTSSRSHLVVMIDIAGRHEDGITFMQGGLRLCDLAGSERLDRTGTASDANRLKETVNINKSLSCLADVFCALSNKASHIPYRNSKLTMLLQVR